MAFRKIPDPHTPQKMFCRADPERLLLEFQRAGITTIVDLKEYGFQLPATQTMPSNASNQDEQKPAA